MKWSLRVFGILTAIVFAWNAVFLAAWHEFGPLANLCSPRDNEDFSVCPSAPILWHDLLAWNVVLALALAAWFATRHIINRRRDPN